MKTLGKIKLNQFCKDELDRRKLNALKGGCNCTFGWGSGCNCGKPTYNTLDWIMNAGLTGGDRYDTVSEY